jgi:hypothetical protein
MDIIAEQQAAIRSLRVSLHEANRRRDYASIGYYAMMIQKKLMMCKCLEKAREEVKSK